MDILCNIIRCTQPPLSEPLLNSVFPVVVNTILASDDNSVLQVWTWCQNITPNYFIIMELLPVPELSIPLPTIGLNPYIECIMSRSFQDVALFTQLFQGPH